MVGAGGAFRALIASLKVGVLSSGRAGLLLVRCRSSRMKRSLLSVRRVKIHVSFGVRRALHFRQALPCQRA
jgi:hypothetical protein